MAEDWDAIAADVADAIASVGFDVTLRRRTITATSPWQSNSPTETDYTATVVQDNYRVRDERGNLIGQTIRTLTVAVGGVVPAKADRVLIAGAWSEIAEVRPLAPGGVAVLYDLDLSA